MIELRIDCKPVSWLAHGGYGRRSYNRRHAEKLFYQLHWKETYALPFPLTSPLHCIYTFAFSFPSSYSTAKKCSLLARSIFHTTRPDASNLAKFCEDTLKGIVIHDDQQVVKLEAQKIYAETSYTLVKIIPLS